ncbi:NTP transferase domain-containing protein, partial [candidate division KSB1 bacterium]
MDPAGNDKDLIQFLESISDRTDRDAEETAIILAAGQGRRIKSRTSKMLHTIWGKPTVARVCQAVEEGLGPHRQIIVLGVEARQVAETLGKKPGRIFIYQGEQLGTGHAVRIALEAQARAVPPKSIYILPGDMGLLSASTIRALKSDFGDNACHMMLLTGSYSGDPAKNHYGRIVRVPADGDSNRDSLGTIVAIKEFKDIDALPEEQAITIHHNRNQHSFGRSELLAVSEFNTGAYVCRGPDISRLINDIQPSPATGEYYLTDL